MNGSGFGMLSTFSMPDRIHRSASSGVRTSSRSTSGYQRRTRSPRVDFWLASKDSWLIPMTESPLVSARATHSIAQTWVTITTAPGAAARHSSLSSSALARIPARRAAWRRRSGR